MACELMDGGIPKDCKNNIGGVKKIWITDFVNLVSKTVAPTDDEITAITLATGTSFYEFAFNKNTSSMTDNAIYSVENGSLYYEQIISLVIPHRENSKRKKLASLMQKELAVIVLDSNGHYWLVGGDLGAWVSELPSTSGVVAGDSNSYTVTITGNEPFQAYEIDPAIIAAIISV